MNTVCDICAAKLVWYLSVPVCACKTLHRCPTCHFRQLAATGKGGICDVCKTERCEVGVLSVLPLTSQLYPWHRALHTGAVTRERCPTLLFPPSAFMLVTLLARFFAGVAIGCVTVMARVQSDELFSAMYCVALALLVVQSVVDAVSLAVYAAPDQNRRWSYNTWSYFTMFLWIHTVIMAAQACPTPSATALLLCLFIASRFPGWCIDAALIVRMRRYLASQLKEEHGVVVEQGPPGAVPP